MATTTKPKPVAKKAPVKAAPVKKTAPKPVAKKASARIVPPAPTKAEAAAAEKAKAEKVAAAASRKTATENARKERAATNESLKNEVARLRFEGNKWGEVATALGISQGKAQLLGAIAEGQAAGVKKPSVAAIVKDRDEGKLGWVAIATKYGLTKSQTQKLYAESGKDPSATYIGRGGRYFSHESAIADQRAAAKASKTTSAPKATGSKSGKPSAPKAPMFTDESTKEEIVTKLEGKVLTTTAGVSSRVKGGSVKVGRGAKSGKLAISFTDAKTGGTRTVNVDQIASVTVK